MTEEQYRQEQEERRRLINEYDRLVSEYNRLVEYCNQIQAEYELAQENLVIIINNTRTVAGITLPKLDYSIDSTDTVNNMVYEVTKAIESLKEKYYALKNVSTSSKKLTELDDIYHRKFRFYDKLRKVSLGYVIGIDSNIISNETLRTEVENQQLMNSEYWLSYALSSVMLWVNDSPEASQRAMEKAMSINQYKTILYFLLVNLRFGRIEAAKQWYLLFSSDVDIFNIRPEWEYILQAVLHNGFGYDKEFMKQVNSKFVSMLNEMKESFPSYERKIIEKVIKYGLAYPYSTDKNYEYLELYSLDYKTQIKLLNNAEKKAEISKYYISVFEEDDKSASDLREKLENVLYSLILSNDENEYDILKQIHFHEYVVKSNGDLSLANQMLELQTEKDNENLRLDELIFKFAFADKNNDIDNRLQKFAISFMIDEIKAGYDEYQKEYKNQEKDTYTMCIDGCTFEHNENNLNSSRNSITKYYKANMRKKKFSDKKYKFYLGTSITSFVFLILTIAIICFMRRFVPVTTALFVVFLISTILFVILFCLRDRYRGNHIREEMLRSLEKLRKLHEDFVKWKDDYNKADNLQTDLQDALNKYKWEDKNE